MNMKAFGMAIAATCLFVGFAAADVFMKGEDVAKIIVGNTVEGKYRDCSTAGSRDFMEFYTKDGKIRGEERNCNQAGNWKRYNGSWAIKDGKFCVAVGSGRPSGCFDYQVDKDSHLHRIGPSGANVDFTIYDGNMKHL